MRNPTSACPRLPHAARGTSPRSTNCPENGPPYPQNGSCWTRRIVSAADRFEADSFPKIEKLGGGTNRRSSARPEGPPRRLLRRRWLGRAPHLPAVAPAHPPPTRPTLPGGVSRQRTINAQSHAEATGSLHQANDQPFVYLPGSEGAKKRADYPPNYNNQTARCRRRPPAPPSDRCDAVALRCATMPQATPTRHRQVAGALWRPLHNRHSRTHPPSSPHPHTATPQPSPAWPSRQRPGIQGGGAARGTPLTPSPHKAVAQRPPATGSVT